MCSVICRVGFEFISLSIQLENISNKPKMSSTRLCKVKLAKLALIPLGRERSPGGSCSVPWHEAARAARVAGDRARQLPAPGLC